MPTTNYDVYCSEVTLIAAIEQYTNEEDASESEFFKEAATAYLEAHGYLGETKDHE